MLFKIRFINELLRFSANQHLCGEGKKYISKKQPEMNELRQTALWKLLSLYILLSFNNYYYLFIHLPVRMCAPCVEVATPVSLSSHCNKYYCPFPIRALTFEASSPVRLCKETSSSLTRSAAPRVRDLGPSPSHDSRKPSASAQEIHTSLLTADTAPKKMIKMIKKCNVRA